MKMKTKMTILDQELSQSAVGMYEKYLCVDFLWLLIPVLWVHVGPPLLSLRMSQVAHQATAYTYIHTYIHKLYLSSDYLIPVILSQLVPVSVA